ncbi:hypothetical protein [Seonamhaeicola maritimus]|uniref:hypothetical protein n=1 Tax=Seonamhaeicola maritimus TaxID=2591822 RepID=UPI0011CB6C37|nr:hypothetical protein [Seonamhaeicola maritimus]
MGRPININSTEEIVDLKASRYRIYSLGGFGVNLNQFSISLKNIATDESIKCKKAFWPVQAYAFGKRAKRILIVDIPEEGRYEVLFDNPETLRIKHSNLPISSMFRKPLATDKIEILITEKLGVWPKLK